MKWNWHKKEQTPSPYRKLNANMDPTMNKPVDGWISLRYPSHISICIYIYVYLSSTNQCHDHIPEHIVLHLPTWNLDHDTHACAWYMLILPQNEPTFSGSHVWYFLAPNDISTTCSVGHGPLAANCWIFFEEITWKKHWLDILYLLRSCLVIAVWSHLSVKATPVT